MKYVNEALEGRWPEVAIGETGSLVVQNIFENCLEEDKVLLCLHSFSKFLTDSGEATMYWWSLGQYWYDRTWTVWQLVYSTHLVRTIFKCWRALCWQTDSEHGAPHDREFAINTVIVKATEYSVDQFASKVVEKCLKVGGTEFVDRYLDRVCEGRHDRPRIPLIDSTYLVLLLLRIDYANSTSSC